MQMHARQQGPALGGQLVGLATGHLTLHLTSMARHMQQSLLWTRSVGSTLLRP